MRTAEGTLYLVPVGLGEATTPEEWAPATLAIVRSLDTFVAENARTARKFLKDIGHPRPLQSLRINVLDERPGRGALDAILDALGQGLRCGLMSEAGCPAVADPGALLVRRAHDAGVPVVPLVGPSSILLALMGSGMNGQRFVFHGYLPADRGGRSRAIRSLERDAARATQIFIETPYRNTALLEALLAQCRPDTLLCVAAELTLPGALLATRTIARWRTHPPDLARRPTVFLLQREAASAP